MKCSVCVCPSPWASRGRVRGGSQQALCNCLMLCNDRCIMVIKAFIRIKICFENGSINCLKRRGSRKTLTHGQTKWKIFTATPLRRFLTWYPRGAQGRCEAREAGGAGGMELADWTPGCAVWLRDGQLRALGLISQHPLCHARCP